MHQLLLLPKRRAKRGFTLMEMMFSVGLMSLVLLGATELFINTTRTAVKTTAALSATADAANAIQQVIELTREAKSFSLSGENTFNPGAVWTASQFQTLDGTETIVTGMVLNMPPNQPASTPINVVLTGGTNLKVDGTLYNINGASVNQLLIYRGNSNGSPNASSGTYLWEYSVQDGGATVNRVLCKSVSPAINAVQFVRPTTTPGVDGGQPLAWQVELKLISGYYSPINTTQTSEGMDGSRVSQLTGKCVFMRDHDQTAAPSNANTKASNNAFQYTH